MTNYQDLKGALEAAEAAVDDLTDQVKAALADANSSADALNTELTTAKQQVTSLQAALDECEDGGGTPPEPPDVDTNVIFGSSDVANIPGYNEVDISRKYYSGQIDTSWKNSNAKAMVESSRLAIWISFKAKPGTGTNTNLEQWLKSIQADDGGMQGFDFKGKKIKVMVTVFHEPENDGGDPSGGHNMTEYQDAYKQAKAIVDRYDFAILGPVRMNSKDQSLNDKYWPTVEVDFDGWDCYFPGIQCPKDNYSTKASEVYKKVLASPAKTGKPLAIGETGVGVVQGTQPSDSRRTAQIKDAHKTLAAADAIAVLYWNAANEEGGDCNNPNGTRFVTQVNADAWFKG